MAEVRTFTFPNSLITRTVDGDSHDVEAVWEQPFYVRPAVYPIRLRIAGVDCWPGGLEAQRTGKATELGMRAYGRALELVAGKRLTVVTYEQYAYRGPKGTVGEWVGDIVLPFSAAGVLLSRILLDEGLALPYDGKGKRPTALGA